MYPTAYTLTVLVLTLLQYSFDKRYAKHSCQDGQMEGFNSTVCTENVRRKEIRQLSRREFEDFVQVFNDYSTRNDTDELNANINEMGVVQIFDELLQPMRLLTPYWEYRFELSLTDPTSSSLWSAPQFEVVRQAKRCSMFAEEDRPMEDEDFFGNDPFSKLWQRRQLALKTMRELRKTDVFWHLLLLVSIETGIDQTDCNIRRLGNVNRTTCMREYGRFARWLNNTCVPTLSEGRECGSAGDCFHRRCSKGVCESMKRLPTILTTSTTTTEAPTTQQQTTRMITTTPVMTSTTEIVDILSTTASSTQSILTVDENTIENQTETSTVQPTSQIDTLDTPTVATQPFAVQTSTQTTHETSTEILDQSRHNLWSQNTGATTEFLAKELTTERPFDERRNRKQKKRKNKKNKHRTTTPSPFHDQIPATASFHNPTVPTFGNSTVMEETNSPIEAEQYGTDTLDNLLVFLPTPKVPAGMITWNARMPFRMAYFSFTIIEGSLGRNRRLKEKGHRRPKGARIYVKGLDMPSGYTQVTQGRPMKNGIGALARTLHPDNNGPFVEFKIRVENRYGTPCKQMCLDSHQRYRRSPYKRFSDPVPYFETEERAIEAQWTGKGYYKKRKLGHLLFKCE
ncbi:hypothetical protein M3Y94_00238600 [Aphelenchoides besseyi]|nr:hypothetical protein M3Y94_00238600 [Aphelenchoides besseyi]